MADDLPKHISYTLQFLRGIDEKDYAHHFKNGYELKDDWNKPGEAALVLFEQFSEDRQKALKLNNNDFDLYIREPFCFYKDIYKEDVFMSRDMEIVVQEGTSTYFKDSANYRSIKAVFGFPCSNDILWPGWERVWKIWYTSLNVEVIPKTEAEELTLWNPVLTGKADPNCFAWNRTNDFILKWDPEKFTGVLLCVPDPLEQLLIVSSTTIVVMLVLGFFLWKLLGKIYHK